MVDCKSLVPKGTKVRAEDMSEDNVYKVRAQCLTYNGKFVKLAGEGDAKKFKPVPMRPEDDGVFTYLFDQDKKIHTARVANRFEIGSLHMTLAFVSKATRVLAAGELKKTGSKIEFNLISGTYMQKWMVSMLEDECDKEIQDQTVALFKAALPGMEIIYKDEDFITDVNVPVTREQLNSYLDAGYEVRLYDSEDSCRLDADIIQIRIAVWEKMPHLAKEVEKAKADLVRSKDYALYARAGRRKTRRTIRRATRRKRRA